MMRLWRHVAIFPLKTGIHLFTSNTYHYTSRQTITQLHRVAKELRRVVLRAGVVS